MINWRQIFKLLGLLLYIEAGQLFVTMLVAFFYNEDVMPYALTIILAAVLGGVGIIAGINAGKSMSRRDGYIIVSLVWMVFTLIGMLPFILTDSVPDAASAFFEAMSGFTSTGATIIDEIDSLPRGIIFWRSMTQWIGGIGIIFFTIAILPAFGVGEVKLFAAEATGPLHDKVHPRISVAVRWIGTVYLMLTITCIISLLLCGMGLFDAVNISMTTTATGGFSPHAKFFSNQFHSPAIEYVVTLFMFLSGINYTLIYYTILKGRIRRCLSNPELRTYITLVASMVIFCAVVLMFNNPYRDYERSFREALFTIVSLQTTTGYANCDYTLWPQVLMPVLAFAILAGACSGSTSGGFKCIRWAILLEVMRNEFKRIVHPRAVIPAKINGEMISTSVQKTLLGFCILFVGTLFAGTLLLLLTDIGHQLNYTEAFSLSLSSISTVGPALDYFGPAHSWAIINPAAKVICGMLMLVGRLEIFPIFLLFTRSFWKED